MSPTNAAYIGQGPHLSVPSTPARDRDKHVFPSSSHSQPSPAPSLRQTTSSVSNNFPPGTPSIQISSQTVSVEALLKQHASASDPRTAALEQAVNDRNVLSAQNAQLWKLIEKQRAGYNQILKELERIRGERDGYKSKLVALGAISNSSDKRQKTTSERGSRPSLELSAGTPVSASILPAQNRTPAKRHNSNDSGPIPRSALHPPQLHASRSYEPQLMRSPEFSSSIQVSSANPSPSIATPQSSAHSVPPSASSLISIVSSRSDEPLADQITTASKSGLNGTHGIHPVFRQPRTSSLAESVTSVRTSSSTPTPPTSSASSNITPGDSPSSATYSATAHTSYTVSPLAEHRQNQVQNHTVGVQSTPSQGTPLPTGSTPTTQQSLLPPTLARLAPVPENRHLSLDSRVSLPDEARQYITNMSDSPVDSPRAETFSQKSRLGTTVYPPQSTSSATDSGQDSEFLDLGGEESDEESDTEITADVTAGAKDPIFDSIRTQAPIEGQQIQRKVDHDTPSQQVPQFNPFLSQTNNPSKDDLDSRHQWIDQSRVEAEEFPLPPPSQFHHRQQNPQSFSPMDIQTQHYSGHHNPSQQSLSMQPPSTPSARPSPTESSIMQSQSFEHQMQGSPTIPASFRALPLLSADLPHTSVTVSHSFVRPNDRGKEVLSFIVYVNPGNGKEGWKVEKMYSDVLSLDQRVRSSVGKGVGKKIANLPEGKLWKDHAPAKVDQRKAVLEHYLQSLIRLPVKNNDEVIAFFTSDIAREQKPVMQAGHKEGYLTKRGKNFGGWKTRFFVLQGPVLEYYDCRGGAYLGSITIAGAQIARQHRPPNNDDEKEYRHAFLILEAKKGPGGNQTRHVLCAESDEDRDSWVEMLVRYLTGTYSEDVVSESTSGSKAMPNTSSTPASHSAGSQPRLSTSSEIMASPVGPRTKPMSRTAIRDEISRGPAVPISQLPPDPNNAKLFQPVPTLEDYVRSSSPSRLEPSTGDRQVFTVSDAQKRIMERSGLGLPSSLPDPSLLSSAAQVQQDNATPTLAIRSNSELGHYPDLQDNRAAKRQPSLERRPKDDGRKSFYPGAASIQPAPERVPSPEKTEGKVKISGPMNGAPIPTGFKFGGKDAPSDLSLASSDRREKAKSRSFWAFGKGEKQTHPNSTPRTVFGVPLEEALDVSQICNLPSIVFRSIQYLEAKKADQEEGIYRLSGSSAVIKSLKDRFNNEGDVDLLGSDEFWDPHAIAGLLKSYLRELPSSILTRELHLRFLAVIDFVDPQERIKELSQLIAALPLVNYSLLRAMTAHLILIVQNSNVNKMTMRNVGIVFSPTLGIPAGVFSLMLGEFNRVFDVDAADAMSRDGMVADTSDPLRRNSRQYSDAAADQFLGLAGRTLSPSAEDAQSEGDDSSIQEESGTETTEGEGTMESSSSSPAGIRIHVPDTPDTPIAKPSKAQFTAATKGLNVAVATSDRGNRHSRMIGLPVSPRPHHSPSKQI